MVSHVYRYQSTSINLADVNSELPSVATLESTGPAILVDVTVDETAKSDLDVSMDARGFVFLSTDPSTTPAQNFMTATPVVFAAGTAVAPSITFGADTDTGLYNSGPNNIAIVTGGVERFNVSTTAINSILPHAFLLGVAAAPSITFSGDLNTGMWSSGADNINFATNGADRVNISTTAFTSTLVVVAPLGAAATPSHTFTGDLDTGLFSSLADTLDLATGGTSRFTLSTTTLTTTLVNLGPAGAVGAPTWSFSGDPDCGLYSSGPNNIALVTNGTSRLNISTSSMSPSIVYANVLGAVGAPSYTFSGDLNTGWYSSGADTIDGTTNGVNRFSISTTAITVTLPNYGADGAAATPQYTFASDTDIGMYRSGANILGFATNGVSRLTISTTTAGFTTVVALPAGAIGAPSMTFTGDVNTGIFSPGADTVACTANATERFRYGATGISFFAAAEVVQQTVGANVNNCTASGTTGQFDNWTDLIIYANDAAAIHNTVSQLSRSVAQLTVTVRNYGLGA